MPADRHAPRRTAEEPGRGDPLVPPGRHDRPSALPLVPRGRAGAINYRFSTSGRKLLPKWRKLVRFGEDEWLTLSVPYRVTSPRSCRTPCMLLAVGVLALLMLIVVLHHIHKIHSE